MESSGSNIPDLEDSEAHRLDTKRFAALVFTTFTRVFNTGCSTRHPRPRALSCGRKDGRWPKAPSLEPSTGHPISTNFDAKPCRLTENKLKSSNTLQVEPPYMKYHEITWIYPLHLSYLLIVLPCFKTCGQFESLGLPLGSAITEALELYNAAVNCLVVVFQMSTSVPAAESQKGGYPMRNNQKVSKDLLQNNYFVKLHGITFHFTGGLKRQHGGDTVDICKSSEAGSTADFLKQMKCGWSQMHCLYPCRWRTHQIAARTSKSIIISRIKLGFKVEEPVAHSQFLMFLSCQMLSMISFCIHDKTRNLECRKIEKKWKPAAPPKHCCFQHLRPPEKHHGKYGKYQASPPNAQCQKPAMSVPLNFSTLNFNCLSVCQSVSSSTVVCNTSSTWTQPGICSRAFSQLALFGHEGSTWRHMPVNWCCIEAPLRPGDVLCQRPECCAVESMLQHVNGLV